MIAPLHLAGRTSGLIVALLAVAYTPPPRVPDELLASDLSDRNVRVWLAVRKVQGANATAWAKASHYAEVAGKTESATRNALSELVGDGWIEHVGKRGRTPEIRCVLPPEVSRTVTNFVTHRDESDAGSVTEAEVEVSRTVTNNVTHRDTSHYKEESGQGIQKENNNNTRAQAREEGGRTPARKCRPF